MVSLIVLSSFLSLLLTIIMIDYNVNILYDTCQFICIMWCKCTPVICTLYYVYVPYAHAHVSWCVVCLQASQVLGS